MARTKETTNEFGVKQSKEIGKATYYNDYSDQTDEQRAAQDKSLYDNDNQAGRNKNQGTTTQMASVVNAALGKTNPKTWDEFTSGKDLDKLSGTEWRNEYKKYSDYLGDDKFGLTGSPAYENMMASSGGVSSGFGGDVVHRNQADMVSYDQATYNRITDKSFEDFLKYGDPGLADADYITQRDAYKKNREGLLTNPRDVVWGKGGTDNIPSHVKQTTFADVDPGLFTAGDDYGQFAGGYRTQGEVDTKFRDYYSDEINKLGYGNLVTEGLDNAGYLAAFDQATNRKGLADQITGLGYGSMVNPNMTADQLNTAFGEATERNKFKDLLDGMGTSYGDMDSSSSLGSLYDTTSKLNVADQKAAGLTTELGLLNTDFDALSTDYGALQGDNTALTTDLSALQGASQQQQGMAAANAAAADKAQRASSGIASIPGPAATGYTQAVEPTGATALNPYQMAPIDFTGGLAGAGSSGSAMDNTNIFDPAPMSMTQNTFDLNQSFNPYFDALNTQYGIPPVGETT